MSHVMSEWDYKKFIGERVNLIFNAFINFKPVERFKNWSGMSEFRSLDKHEQESFESVATYSRCTSVLGRL